MTNQTIFNKLFFAKTEDEVATFLEENPTINKPQNWAIFGSNENYFGVVESQQASPIPALVEKVTNSIDAVLLKECKIRGIDPSSSEAPKSMEEAVDLFFPRNNLWEGRKEQRKQAEEIQIVADGPKGENSLIIYDNGEGQHPADFEDTFLSLLKGNKVKIQFVQGKFNMGGSGALTFCGKRRYQLVASKKYDGSGKFGFTLIRRHQLTKEERKGNSRFSYYEYLKIDNEIPAFDIDELDLGLFNRPFKTGTILKLFNYKVQGVSDISRDLNQRLNEYLFKPALPLFTVEKAERYPKTPIPQRELYGLFRRLEKQKETYLDKDDCFREVYKIPEKGKIKVQVYVFKSRIKDKTAKESERTIRDEFFANNMSVIFSLNGQVHGHYTTEFISNTLKFKLLKKHLLIHIDCSELYSDFRNELFMASRDRLKEGDDTKFLRQFLGEKLRSSRLKEINKKKKDKLSLDGGETNEVFQSIAKNISFNSEMMSLINQAFAIEQPKAKNSPPNKNQKSTKKKKVEREFHPKRFPTFFSLQGGSAEDNMKMFQLPLNGERSVRFSTDVENAYFDRTIEPGDMEIAILSHGSSSSNGKKGNPSEPSELLEITESSPDNGTIKINFKPSGEVKVGDSIPVQATLVNSGGENFEGMFLIKIAKAIKEGKPKEVDKKEVEQPMGLPPFILAYKNDDMTSNQEGNSKNENSKTWEELEVPIDHETVIYPVIDDEKLDSIVINMSSQVLKNYKRKYQSKEQLQLADKRYITAIYFHTLLLYATCKQKGFEFKKTDEQKDYDLAEYLQEIFSGHYASFLLSFGIDELMQNIDD